MRTIKFKGTKDQIENLEELFKFGSNDLPIKVSDNDNINIPNYYIGSVYGYEARKVIEDWNLSYNIGTATSYLLRCGKKTEEGMDNKAKHIEDIEKAINHLRFEIDKLNNLK